MRVSFITLALALWPALASGAEWSADIETDTVWTLAESPYRLAADVTVGAGATLTLEPGVVVELAADVSLIVEGEFVAVGTADEPIVFTGASGEGGPARWRSVWFRDSAVDATFVDLDDYESGSILSHCVLEHGTRALSLDAAAPYVHACTFRHNVFEAEAVGGEPAGAALYIGPDSTPRVVGCDFTENQGTLGGHGGAVYVDDAAPILQDNRFSANLSAYGGALTTYRMVSPIVGNTFEDNEGQWEGGAVSMVSSSPAFLNNLVRANVSTADGGGLHVCVDCYPHAKPIVMDNTFTDNTNKLHGAAGVGAAYLRVFAYNNLYGNNHGEAPSDFGWFNDSLDFYPEWVTHPSVAHNWWGTTDTAAVAASIFDGHDEEGYGLVTFEPVLEAPVAAPTARATVTTRKIRYQNEGEPMPVFLTVYNPGEARDYEILLLLEWGDDGPRVPYLGALALPEYARDGELHRFHMPTNAVHFATLVIPEYAPLATDHGTWHVALFDAADGSAVGDVVSARFELGEGGEVLP